jgi:uncharacterized protein YndB with AHSA1/START domain
MGKPEFVYVTYIATTPERLWDALTDGQFTRQYWYDRRIESSWESGAPVRFYDGASATITDEGIVLVADRPRQLAYTFRYTGQPAEEPASRVTFSLEPGDGLVKLTLVHDLIGAEEAVAGWREGWSPILSSLKTLLESGRPLPQQRSIEERSQATG